MKIFLDVAEDEMEHYAETMLAFFRRSVQAEMLAEALDDIVMKRPMTMKWATAKTPEAADVAVPQTRFARRSVITKAIQDGISRAASKYRRARRRREPRVKGFCHLMNEEKSTSQNLPLHYSCARTPAEND